MVRPNRRSSTPYYEIAVPMQTNFAAFPRASRFKAKARYYLDQSMENPHVTSFSFVLSGGLLVTALALVHLLLHRAFHPHGFEISLSDAYWQMWSYMADPGTHADICPVEIESDPDADDHYCADHEDGAECRRRAKYYCIALQSWSFFGAFCGIVYFATMLGFLVEGVQSSMARLKLGRNRVVEEDHIVVLGFTDKALALICELALALESDGGGCIVLLVEADAPTPFAEVEQLLCESLTHADLRGTRVVLRQGSPMFVTDLMRVATADARAVIVLSDTSAGDADSCDAKVLRTVLSLRGLPETLRGFIIAELQDVDNRQIVQLIGGDQIEVVVSHDICGRLMLMAARHPGLAVVYADNRATTRLSRTSS